MNQVIQLKNVSKSFNQHAIFKEIELNVEKGKTIGFIGSNGIGKSVLFKMICGFVRPDHGTVHVHGTHVGVDCDFPDRVGIFINNPGFIELYNGFENLKFLAGIQNKIKDEEIIKAMRTVGLDPFNKTRVKNYSMGMKQKLGIAQAIMEGQDIVILDEPFNTLDYQASSDLQRLIKQLKSEEKTILLTSHNHNYLESLCDELFLIKDQQLIPFTEEIKKEYFSF